MERAKRTALAVERAHRSGERMLLSDGDGRYSASADSRWRPVDCALSLRRA